MQLLKNGCTQMRKSFDIEDINLDELIDTAMKDPQALTGEIKAFKGLNFSDLLAAYRQFCKNEQVTSSAVDIGEVITFYNKAMTDLPDHQRLKGYRLPAASIVLDGKGARFAEVFEPNHRRVWVALSEVPEVVQKAFIAAEDKRFFQHTGVDERAVIRAFVTSMGRSGRPQGGSTITQQVVKTLLVGDDVTYERKIREIVIASRVERLLSKQEILELYLNSIYLGRGSWGIEMAAQSYFGKPAKQLTLEEGALLAGLDQGAELLQSRPAAGARAGAARLCALSPAGRRHHRARRDQTATVCGRPATPRCGLSLCRSSHPRGKEGGRHHQPDHDLLSGALDHQSGDAAGGGDRAAGRPRPLRDERRARPLRRGGDEPGRCDQADRGAAEAGGHPQRGGQAGLAAGAGARAAAALRCALEFRRGGGEERSRRRCGWACATGASCRSPLGSAVRRNLNLHDVVYVRVVEDGKGRSGARAELRVRPSVQGAALVLENKTGRILAMTGGFSYPLSQLNRVAQAARQPGSALKPLTFLAALGSGLQPNTTVLDEYITLPPIGGGRNSPEEHYWTPKNYGGDSKGAMTLRSALENSRNLVTARLLDGAIRKKPEDSLKQICTLAKETRIYSECIPYYPFVLGAQPVRVIDLATFYAAIANEGMRPEPHAVEAVELDGEVLYRRPQTPLVAIDAADKVAFFQLKSILQGVLARGTGRRIGYMAPYVGGKTGTSTDWNDAWFVGFTNDVTVAVWVGYDNSRGTRRTLGGGGTGSGTAIPIFEPIMKASWEHVAPQVALAPPTPETKRLLIATSGQRKGKRDDDDTRTKRATFVEYLRVDRSGRIIQPAYKVALRSETQEKEKAGKTTQEKGKQDGAKKQKAKHEGAKQKRHYARKQEPRDRNDPREFTTGTAPMHFRSCGPARYDSSGAPMSLGC